MLDLDKTIHEPVRLKVMMILSGVDSADFCSICQTLELTRGNLSAHVSKLEAAHYVRMKKTIVGKVPHTEFSLTKKGRKAIWIVSIKSDVYQRSGRPRRHNEILRVDCTFHVAGRACNQKRHPKLAGAFGRALYVLRLLMQISGVSRPILSRRPLNRRFPQ